MSEAFQPGFGARLKAGRENKKFAVGEVAAKLKLTGRQVEAIEAEDLSHLPNPVFVRGFVRNYARLVDVDPDSLIAPVDAQTAVAETITAPNAGVAFSSHGLRRWVVFPLVALVVFLLLVAGLYHWLRQGEESLVLTEQAGSESVQALPATPGRAPAGTQSSQSVSPSPAMQEASPAMVPPAQPAEQRQAAPTPASAATLEPASAPTTAADRQAVISPPPVAAASAPTREAPAAARSANAHSLRFEPSEDAWIQVVDGKGSRFSKLVVAGSVESFSGEPPFRLVVGEAARVRMSYDGHVIDLTPFIGQKVARLTLE